MYLVFIWYFIYTYDSVFRWSQINFFVWISCLIYIVNYNLECIQHARYFHLLMLCLHFGYFLSKGSRLWLTLLIVSRLTWKIYHDRKKKNRLVLGPFGYTKLVYVDLHNYKICVITRKVYMHTKILKVYHWFGPVSMF